MIFIKDRVANASGLELDFSSVREIKVENLAKEINLPKRYVVYGIDAFGKALNINVEVNCDSDADFDNFTYHQVVHDGTMLFIAEAIKNCLLKPFRLHIHNEVLGIPSNNDTVKYIIGNLIVVDEFGEKFATKEIPWTLSRTTVLMPLKCELMTDRSA